jgi:uncharacterized membrane protein
MFKSMLPAGITALLIVSTAVAGPVYNFYTYQYPGASQTYIETINNDGAVAGYFVSGGNTHAFVLQNGTATQLDVPGAATTYAYGMNDHGDIAGSYVDTNGVTHAYLYSGGSFTEWDAPGASRTTFQDVDNSGNVVGNWSDGGTNHAFLWTAGTISETFSYPGAILTSVQGMNNQGDVAGVYCEDTWCPGWLRYLGSVIDLGTMGFPGALQVTAEDISSTEVVGWVIDAGGGRHGFAATVDDSWTVDVPGAFRTYVYGLNDLGVLAGTYRVESNYYGFVATPVPEPAVAGLTLIGVALFAGMAIRRR